MAKRIVLAGGSGFVGQALAARFLEDGYEVHVLSRGRASRNLLGTSVPWDGETIGPWAESLEDAAAVINLAGKNINCRPTRANRRDIAASRVVRDAGHRRSGRPVPPSTAGLRANGRSGHLWRCGRRRLRRIDPGRWRLSGRHVQGMGKSLRRKSDARRSPRGAAAGRRLGAGGRRLSAAGPAGPLVPWRCGRQRPAVYQLAAPGRRRADLSHGNRP